MFLKKNVASAGKIIAYAAIASVPGVSDVTMPSPTCPIVRICQPRDDGRVPGFAVLLIPGMSTKAPRYSRLANNLRVLVMPLPRLLTSAIFVTPQAVGATAIWVLLGTTPRMVWHSQRLCCGSRDTFEEKKIFRNVEHNALFSRSFAYFPLCLLWPIFFATHLPTVRHLE